MTILSTGDAAEIFLPAVHLHKLKKTEPAGDVNRFKCDGWKEDNGAGVRYTCTSPACNFDLHTCCAKLAGARLVHPFDKSIELKFLYEAPTSENDRRLCDACGGKVLGFNYQCGNLNLHPCCAELPALIEKEDLAFELREKASHKCTGCGGSGGYMTFWFYRSKCKKYYLHVRCVKEILLGQQLNQLAAAAGSSSSSSSSSSAAVAAGDVVTTFVKERALEKYKKKMDGETFERILRVVATVLRVILGVLIGDPTTLLIAGAAFLPGSG